MQVEKDKLLEEFEETQAHVQREEEEMNLAESIFWKELEK